LNRKSAPDPAGLACPIPLADYPSVQLAHGGGGRLSQMLVEKLFVAAFDNPQLDVLHDGAVISLAGVRLAFSTDSFVVRPLFFPGGDIGSLAVHGTVNDLAMCGARPLALSAGPRMLSGPERRFGYTAGVTLELPLFSQSQALGAQAKAQRRQVAAELDARQLDLDIVATRLV